MTTRTSFAGNAMPGGRIEYRGDLTPPDTSYASAAAKSPLTSTARAKPSTPWTGSAVVSRKLNRGGIECFYSHGGYRMRPALPQPHTSGPPDVESSKFQQYNVQLFQWHIVPSLYSAGYPAATVMLASQRNLALSTAVPQPQTNVVGAPGQSRMVQRPIFNRVQQVQRPRAVVQTYNTRGAGS